jgi:hypothetical protein
MSRNAELSRLTSFKNLPSVSVELRIGSNHSVGAPLSQMDPSDKHDVRTEWRR